MKNTKKNIDDYETDRLDQNIMLNLLVVSFRF